MKSRLLLLSCAMLVVAVFSQSAAATPLLQAVLYPARILLDGEAHQLPTDQPMLLYNEKAYVPLRYFAELAGVGVGYDGSNQSIVLSRNADEHASAVYDDILFTVHTAKKVYERTEAIPIWASAEYIGENSSIEVIGYAKPSGTRIIHANITDQDGFHVPFGFDDVGSSLTLKKNKPVTWDLSPSIHSYLYIKSGSKLGFDQYRNNLMETGENNRLPAGSYTITALIRYELGWGMGNNEQQLKLDIEVR